MLKPVADGVLVHTSEFCQSNAVAIHGADGVLLVDAGVTDDELSCLANDLRQLGRSVVAGFSTHPHWDHLLWHDSLGDPPRYATERCAATVRERLPDAAAKARIAPFIPPDIVDRVPLDLLGEVTGLPSGAPVLPWNGPTVRVAEHQAHATGHAALLIDDGGVLIAGDMLSDLLVPMLDLGAADPVADYLAALQLLEEAAGDVDAVVPGHGSVGGPGQVRERLERDRAYVEALREGREPDDPRAGPSATVGLDWNPGVHERQLQHLARL